MSDSGQPLDLLTISQVADRFHLTESRINQMIRYGEFPIKVIDLGGRRRVLSAALDRYFETGEPQVAVDKLLTVHDVAGQLGYTDAQADHLIESESFPVAVQKIGKRRRVLRSDLERYLTEQVEAVG